MANVSVIIPTYQSANTVITAVESALNQTYSDIEVIVVDDGSTDNTAEVLSKFAGRIKVIHQINSGPSSARNNGIRVSTGEFLAFLDADDFWVPDKLERQMNQFSSDPSLGLIFGDCFLFDDKRVWGETNFSYSSPSSGMVFNELFSHNFIPTLTVVVRRKIVEQLGGFDETLKWCEDYDLWLKICAENKVSYIDTPVAYYKIQPGQLTSNTEKILTNTVLIKERWLNNGSQISFSSNVLEEGYFHILLRLVKILLRENRRDRANKYLSEYKRKRGLSFEYVLCLLLSKIPFPVQKIIIKYWEKINRGRSFSSIWLRENV